MHSSKQILILARHLIQEIGFAKHIHKYYMDVDGRKLAYTIIGSLFEAADRLKVPDEKALNSAINTFIIQTDRTNTKNILSPVPYLAKWNDNKDRTKYDVLAVFDEAIACFGEIK
jgi:hypothetical protein